MTAPAWTPERRAIVEEYIADLRMCRDKTHANAASWVAIRADALAAALARIEELEGIVATPKDALPVCIDWQCADPIQCIVFGICPKRQIENSRKSALKEQP